MQNAIEHQAHQESRLERGKRVLSEIDGEAGEKVIDSLADIAPDFARYLLEFPFGDIYSRPGLDVRAREIAPLQHLPRWAMQRPSSRFILPRRLTWVLAVTR